MLYKKRFCSPEILRLTLLKTGSEGHKGQERSSNPFELATVPALMRGLTLGLVLTALWPEGALAGLDRDLGTTSDLVFGKLSPIILGVGCVVGCGYSIVKSSIIGVVGSLGTTAIAGYTLNAIQSGSFLKLLGGE